MEANGDGEITIKKYSNRRLYDTSDSRYITLEELAQKIRDGHSVRVVDAKTGKNLTQATLAQIILESRRAARLLPVPLLIRLIRMSDETLSDFFASQMSAALDAYLLARSDGYPTIPSNDSAFTQRADRSTSGLYSPTSILPISHAETLSKMFSKLQALEPELDASQLFQLMTRRTPSDLGPSVPPTQSDDPNPEED